MITERQLAELENFYRGGFNAQWAADEVGVGRHAAWTAFARFVREDVPRGAVLRRRDRHRLVGGYLGPDFAPGSTDNRTVWSPPYAGPTWIGKQC